MKLLFCHMCQDIFKLSYKLRSCECGRVKGKYLEDNHHAVVNGLGVSIAISNPSLFRAITSLTEKKNVMDYKIFCWVRPNEGPDNPRTTVDKNL